MLRKVDREHKGRESKEGGFQLKALVSKCHTLFQHLCPGPSPLFQMSPCTFLGLCGGGQWCILFRPLGVFVCVFVRSLPYIGEPGADICIAHSDPGLCGLAIKIPQDLLSSSWDCVCVSCDSLWGCWIATLKTVCVFKFVVVLLFPPNGAITKPLGVCFV